MAIFDIDRGSFSRQAESITMEKFHQCHRNFMTQASFQRIRNSNSLVFCLGHNWMHYQTSLALFKVLISLKPNNVYHIFLGPRGPLVEPSMSVHPSRPPVPSATIFPEFIDELQHCHQASGAPHIVFFLKDHDVSYPKSDNNSNTETNTKTNTKTETNTGKT